MLEQSGIKFHHISNLHSSLELSIQTLNFFFATNPTILEPISLLLHLINFQSTAKCLCQKQKDTFSKLRTGIQNLLMLILKMFIQAILTRRFDLSLAVFLLQKMENQRVLLRIYIEITMSNSKFLILATKRFKNIQQLAKLAIYLEFQNQRKPALIRR